MHNHSYENEFNLHVNKISFHMTGWVARLTLRKKLNQISDLLLFYNIYRNYDFNSVYRNLTINCRDQVCSVAKVA